MLSRRVGYFWMESVKYLRLIYVPREREPAEFLAAGLLKLEWIAPGLIIAYKWIYNGPITIGSIDRVNPKKYTSELEYLFKVAVTSDPELNNPE